jgi:hypothetical protein
MPWADQLRRELGSIPEVVLEILGGMGSIANEESGIAGDLMINAELDDGVSISSGIARVLVSADS